jgi:hypothetical protein
VGTLTLERTAHALRMSAQLVRWFTQNTVCGTRLQATGNPARFKEAEVKRFDEKLRGAWNNKNVPTEVSRELRREASGKCAMCDQPNDHLEEAHIKRKGVELPHHCQHPSNLILMCPNCHTRYDSNKGRIDLQTVEHAKKRLVSRLMESTDRDVRLEKLLRKKARELVAAGVAFEQGAGELLLVATGARKPVDGRIAAVTSLLSTAQAMRGDTPLAAGFVLGTAIEGTLDEDVDAFAYIDSLAEPLPTRDEFEDEFDSYRAAEGHDPSPRLIAWAAHAGAAYQCSVCPDICVDPDTLTGALVEHWKQLAEEREDGEDDEVFDEEAVRQETMSTIIHSGVECGDLFGSSGACSYHANALAKDD